MNLVLLIAEFLILFFTAKIIFQSLFILTFILTKRKKIAIFLTAFLFFPGTVIHELAHLFTAGILFVPVKEVEFFPELHVDGLKLGSVQIVQRDFLRRFLIGLAPIIWGSGIIIIFISYLFSVFSSGVEFSLQSLLLYSFILYSIFVISNTMFSSKKDMEGAFGIFIILIIVLIGMFIIKPSIILSAISVLNTPGIASVMQRISLFLLIPCGVNLFLTGIFFLIKKRSGYV